MQSNKDITGRAVFSDEENIREKSLKLYTYLVCHANLRNQPNAFGDNVRIFQQRDIVLSQIHKILGMEERTIKKYWEELESGGLIRFRPRDWREDPTLSFNERWKIRKKHKETYYEIPIYGGQIFRKIPKLTLIKLNEEYQVEELFLKTYITLVNYQEDCIMNNLPYKKFTYQDLREILGYTSHSVTNRKFEDILNHMKALKLIEIEKGDFVNSFGTKIPVFILNQVNFYICHDMQDFDTADENVIKPDQIKRIREINKEEYPDIFKV